MDRIQAPIKNLLLDLDGTLIGVRDLSLILEFPNLFIRTLRKNERCKHLSWWKIFSTMQAINRVVTLSVTPSVSPTVTNDERVIATFAQELGFSISDAAQILHETVTLVFPHLETHFFPIKSARDFIHWVQRHHPPYRMVLATNPVWRKEIIRLRLHWAKIDPGIFDSITHSQRMHACKPSPEYYSEILEQEKMTPSETLLVGNDPKNDLPATRVGISVYLVHPTKKLRSMTLKGQRAPAWTGTFEHLKLLLDPEIQSKSPAVSSTSPSMSASELSGSKDIAKASRATE